MNEKDDDSAVWVPAVALVRIPDMSVGALNSVGALTHQMYRAKTIFQIWNSLIYRQIRFFE
jgi:hypothetical protein